jgi:hypothetical protein
MHKIVASTVALLCVLSFQNCSDFKSVSHASTREPSSVVTTGSLGSTELGVTVEDVAVAPGEAAQIHVTLNQTTPHDISFSYSTVDGTAVAGTHYRATRGSGIISEGTSSTVIRIPTLKKTAATYDGRHFSVDLTSNSYHGSVRVVFSHP